MHNMTCHTVGHSTHSIDVFIALLQSNGINCIVDVRSSPYSRFADQFNRESLSAILKQNDILYLYMGESLGARYEEKELLFPDGKVDFEAVKKTPMFQDGLQRLLDGMEKGYAIALMCSEKEPFDCHRFVLVSKALTDRGVSVSHILPDKTVDHHELEERLFVKYKIQRHDLFNSEKENLEKVYRLRNKDIAYNAVTKEGDDE